MNNKIYLSILLAGLIIRLCFCLFYGNPTDMPQYIMWGKDSLENGLAQSYHGIYYPLQYQVFEFLYYISDLFKIPSYIIFKLGNLLFDIAILYLLIQLLRRYKKSDYYALLYWLNPWFLNNFASGFVDTQYTFLLLLCIFLFKQKGNSWDYIKAGIPLGLAFVLKPQILMIYFALATFVAFLLLRKRGTYKYIYLLLPSILFFLLYEIYFTIAYWPSILIWSVFILPLHYINVANIFPCLTCGMVNFWYPIAELFKEPGEPIYSVLSTEIPLPYFSFKTMALLTSVFVIIRFCFRKTRKIEWLNQLTLIQVVSFIGLFIPFFMTAAHYNHPYIGSVFLILSIALSNNRAFKFSSYLLYLFLFFNIFVYANAGGLYPSLIPISSPFLIIVSILETITSFVVLYFLYTDKYITSHKSVD